MRTLHTSLQINTAGQHTTRLSSLYFLPRPGPSLSLSYLFLDTFLLFSSPLSSSSSSSSQWSVSPSRMGGMEALRTKPGLNTHRW